MVKGVVETSYKLKYFNFLSMKKHREKAKSTGKKQGKHREFCLDWSMATLPPPWTTPHPWTGPPPEQPPPPPMDNTPPPLGRKGH